jgi:GNAT superfamily N-acetyltransferase
MSSSSALSIVPLRAHDTKAFITFPWRVYAGDERWIPPLIMERKEFLNPRKNPFFHHAAAQLFLAQQGRDTVGRIAAVINTAHNQYHNEHAGFFGLFECLPRAEIAAALLEAAASWVRQRGATFLRGPVNLSTNELDCGLLVEGFDTSPVFHSSYNPPYYATYVEANGFKPCKDLLAFLKTTDTPLPSRVQETIARLQARCKVTVRPINMRDFVADVKRITTAYNAAWSDNWGFVPITEAEAQHLAKTLKMAVIPGLTLLAESNGEPVGCFVAIPDLNPALRHLHGHLTPWGLLRFLYHRRRIDTVRVAMMGIEKRYRRLGIDLLLLAKAWEQASKHGVARGELAWILEDNRLMVQALEAIGAHPYKRYRLYQKDVA